MSGGADMLKDGPLISITTVVSAVVQIGRWRWRQGSRAGPPATISGWCGRRSRRRSDRDRHHDRFLLGYDALTYLFGRDVVTPFQVDTYRTARDAGALPLLWLTFVIVAPVAEEIMFRGFLFRGWVRSAAPPSGRPSW